MNPTTFICTRFIFSEIPAELENLPNLPNISASHDEQKNNHDHSFHNSKMGDHLGSIHLVFLWLAKKKKKGKSGK